MTRVDWIDNRSKETLTSKLKTLKWTSSRQKKQKYKDKTLGSLRPKKPRSSQTRTFPIILNWKKAVLNPCIFLSNQREEISISLYVTSLRILWSKKLKMPPKFAVAKKGSDIILEVWFTKPRNWRRKTNIRKKIPKS